MAKIIICLTSVRGRSGKDTLIEQLRLQGHEVTRVAFGDTLKEECARDLATYWNEADKLLDWFHSDMKDVPQATLRIRELPEGHYKEWLMFKADRPNPNEDWMNLNRTPRWHLQQYGTNFRRDFCKDPDVWLNAGIVKIAEAPEGLVVVTDMRQSNEYDALSKLKGPNRVLMVRMHRMWFIPGVDDAEYHITDLDLIGHKMQAAVLNSWGNPAGMVKQLNDQTGVFA
ncbi:deoxynucleoside monophosphate kinase [Pseudomonas phage vB_PpuP-Vasula]